MIVSGWSDFLFLQEYVVIVLTYTGTKFKHARRVNIQGDYFADSSSALISWAILPEFIIHVI